MSFNIALVLAGLVAIATASPLLDLKVKELIGEDDPYKTIIISEHAGSFNGTVADYNVWIPTKGVGVTCLVLEVIDLGTKIFQVDEGLCYLMGKVPITAVLQEDVHEFLKIIPDN